MTEKEHLPRVGHQGALLVVQLQQHDARKLQRLRRRLDKAMAENSPMPTSDELARSAGMSQEELNDFIASQVDGSTEHPIQLRADEVYQAIFDSAIKGNSNSQRLWLQLMALWDLQRQRAKAAKQASQDCKATTESLALPKLTVSWDADALANLKTEGARPVAEGQPNGQ